MEGCQEKNVLKTRCYVLKRQETESWEIFLLMPTTGCIAFKILGCSMRLNIEDNEHQRVS